MFAYYVDYVNGADHKDGFELIFNYYQIEAKILIAKTIQNFNINIDLTQSFERYQSLAIKPKDGTRCTLKFRDYF